jgi:uncharacterized protein YbjT (DUF2867 family)
VLTGPESLSQVEQVVTIAEVIGRSLRYEELSPDEARRELRAPAPVVTMSGRKKGEDHGRTTGVGSYSWRGLERA